MWEQNQEAMKKGLNDADSIIETYNMLMEDAKERKAKERPESRKEAASGKYSIKELPDGSEYIEVDTDQDIFDGVEHKDYPKVAARYIKEHFQNKAIGTINRAYVRWDSTKKYTYSRKHQNDRRMMETKMRASTELPNILDAMKYLRHDVDDGGHPEAVRGWNYYEVVFGFDGVYIKGEVSVMQIDRGDIFYDVSKLKDITSDVTDYEKPHTESENDIFKKSIPRGEGKGNGKYSLQSEQTETPEFKRWFGKSEVVDEDGQPLAVYHTTNSDFTVFDREKLGANSKTASQFLQATAYTGFWFNTASVEQKTGGNAKKVYLSAKRLYEAGTLEGLSNDIWDTYSQFDYNEYSGDPDEAEEKAAGEFFVAWLQSRGYDGIVLEDEEFGGTSYVVFEPTQIKSATDNVGTFDPQNPDIRYSLQDTRAANLDEALLESAALRNRL